MSAKKPKPGYKLVKSFFGKYEEIPEEWEYSRINNFYKFLKGKVPDPLSNVQNDGWFPYLSTNYLDRGTSQFSNDKTSVLVQDSNVIMIVDGSGSGRVYTGISGALSSTFLLFKKKKSEILDMFLYYFLKSKNSIFQSTKFGTSIPHVDKNILNRLLIPIPKISEQQKIASILTNIDSLIDLYGKAIESATKLKRGLMQQLLTKGIGHKKYKKTEFGEIPEEWEVVKMSEVTIIKRGKFSHRPRGDPNYFDGKYPFIQTGNIEKSKGFIVKHSQTLNEKGMSVSKIFPAGIIVVTIVGANIGNTAITTYPVCFPDSIIGISSHKMDIGFLETFLQTKKNYFKNIAINSARENLNLGILENLKIPYPPLPEQKQIFSIFKNIDSSIRDLESKNIGLEHLKKALMEKLLTGNIRVKV